MNSQNFIKIFLGIKIIVVGAAVSYYFGWLSFGEHIAPAQGDDKAPANAAVATNAKEGSPDEGDKALSVPSDKSYLDDLLNLPPLKTEDVGKEELENYQNMAKRAKEQVDQRVEVLNKRAEDLRDLEKSISEKLVKMDEEKQFILNTIQKEKDLQGQRLTSLIDLYTKMEPKKAAPIFEKMDKDLAVALFAKIKEKQVTKILEVMNPDAALKISEYYGRVGSLREYETLKELNKSLLEEFQKCK